MDDNPEDRPDDKPEDQEAQGEEAGEVSLEATDAAATGEPPAGPEMEEPGQAETPADGIPPGGARIIPYPGRNRFEEDPEGGGRSADMEQGDGGDGSGPRFRSELHLDLSGFEGPIDVLLTLARDQKVDLTKISILELADQYLAFVHQARKLRLELAADYLVMAAWLAFLKSRLLLPDPPEDDEPTGEQMAEILAFQLQRLEAMRKAGTLMMELPQLGQDMFARGAPEPLQVDERMIYNVTLYDLLKAYSDHHRRQEHSVYQLVKVDLYSVDEALRWLARLVGRLPKWTSMAQFLPEDTEEGLHSRSAMASTLVAGLELAKQGRMQIRQDRVYGPIFMRSTEEHAGEIEGLHVRKADDRETGDLFGAEKPDADGGRDSAKNRSRRKNTARKSDEPS